MLSEQDSRIDEALEALYGDGDQGGDADSQPDIARFLGDIRKYFPASLAEILQEDALKKTNFHKILQDPEALAKIEPNISLVTKLTSLSKLIPDETKETARMLVQEVVDELTKKLEYPLTQAVLGSLDRATRTNRPKRLEEINWHRTILNNLKHYQKSQKTIIPERITAHGRKRSSLHDIILCLDQSGSMSQSVVYASIFASVLAGLPAVDSKLIIFDTNVVDMTHELANPVDLLFGLRLRGGTNIERAISYVQDKVTRPRDTVLVLISDLFEGSGNKEQLVRRLSELKESGVTMVILLALSDKGAPKFNRPLAQELANLGITSFACTPDLFPELMGAALRGEDISSWAAANGIITVV